MKEFKRTQRVNEQVRRELADIIRREISHPELGMLTVTAVDISPDLKSARVYVTVLGGTLNVKQTVRATRFGLIIAFGWTGRQS